MRLAIFLCFFGSALSAEEPAHFRVETGIGVRLEGRHRFFVEPTAEWVEGKLLPSIEGGVKIKEKWEVFGGIAPLRTGIKIPVWHEVKLAFVGESHRGLRLLGGVSIPLKEHVEFLFLVNTEVAKATLVFKIKKGRH